MTLESQIIAVAREMLRRGLVTGTVGNVSARSAGGILITPTRRHPDDLQPGDLVWLPLDGTPDTRASLEWPMHAEIYRRRADVGAIVHTHSPYATARSFVARPLVVETEERVYLGMDRVDVAPRADAGTRALALGTADALARRPAVLLARHGVVGVAATPRAALEICAAVEHQALIEHVVALQRGAGAKAQGCFMEHEEHIYGMTGNDGCG